MHQFSCAPECHVEITCAKFYQNLSQNMEHAGRNSFMPVRKV